MRGNLTGARDAVREIQTWIDRIYETGPSHPGELDEALEAYQRAGKAFFEGYDAAFPALPPQQWKAIPGYEGLYEVSDQGQVISLRSGNTLTPYPRQNNFAVSLKGHDGKRLGVLVARLVLLAWQPIASAKLFAPAWKNKDRSDNRLSNLKWIPRRPYSKLTDEAAADIRKRWAAGESGADLSREYHVTQAAISHLVSGKTYSQPLQHDE